MTYWLKARIGHTLHCGGYWTTVGNRPACAWCGVWKRPR